jgi:hypothetical protein
MPRRDPHSLRRVRSCHAAAGASPASHGVCRACPGALARSCGRRRTAASLTLVRRNAVASDGVKLGAAPDAPSRGEVLARFLACTLIGLQHRDVNHISLRQRSLQHGSLRHRSLQHSSLRHRSLHRLAAINDIHPPWYPSVCLATSLGQRLGTGSRMRASAICGKARGWQQVRQPGQLISTAPTAAETQAAGTGQPHLRPGPAPGKDPL